MTRRMRRLEEGFTFGELLTWRNATICKFVTVISGMISVNSYMIWVSKLCSTGSLGIARWNGEGGNFGNDQRELIFFQEEFPALCPN